LNNQLRKLDLSSLSRGLPALTSAFGTSLAEAAAVCLVDCGHRSGVQLRVDGEFFGSYSVVFHDVTDQMVRCWNDEEVTTECGAYALAILLVVERTEYTVIERSRKGTGFDYWLGTEGDALFQRKARLEVSGIRSGDEREIQRRSERKQRQVRPMSNPLPAYVVIVEFGIPRGQVTRL
jgi:hypothetical protein